MPAIPPAPVVGKSNPLLNDPFSVKEIPSENSETIFVPPIPSDVQPFDNSTLSDYTINEQEAGKEVNVFFKERYDAEQEAGRRLVEKNRRRAQFKPE